jgi:hypothetical protein
MRVRRSIFSSPMTSCRQPLEAESAPKIVCTNSTLLKAAQCCLCPLHRCHNYHNYHNYHNQTIDVVIVIVACWCNVGGECASVQISSPSPARTVGRIVLRDGLGSRNELKSWKVCLRTRGLTLPLPLFYLRQWPRAGLASWGDA